MTSTKIMKQARESLNKKWRVAIETCFIYFLIFLGIQLLPDDLFLIAYFIVGGPLTLGMAIFSLSISRNTHPHLDQIFLGFNRFRTALIAHLLVGIYTLLWSLLLIVPGIIAALSYSMTFFIIADHPTIEPEEAIRKSKQMMDGHKWPLFRLGVAFLGWAILAVLSLGIGFLWLFPYMQVSFAKFYDHIKHSGGHHS